MTPNLEEKALMPSKLWMLVIFVVCSSIISYGLLGTHSGSGNTAYEMGKNLPIAALAAAVLHFCFKSRESTRTSWIGFGLIYSSLVIASISANNRYLEQKRVLAEDLRATVASLKTSVDKGENLPQIPEFKSKGDSEPARMGAVLKKILQRTADQRQLYEQEFKATKWEGVLDATRLSHDHGLLESVAIVNNAKEVITRFQAKTDELFAKMRLDIEESNLEADSKREMLRGFERSLPQGKADANELWSIEMEIVNTVESIVLELKRNRATWTVEAKQIVFTHQASADSYNRKLERITLLSNKQDQLRQTMLKRSADKIKQIE